MCVFSVWGLELPLNITHLVLRLSIPQHCSEMHKTKSVGVQVQ